MRTGAALVFASCVAMSAVLIAQDPTQQTTPIFRSSTRLVQVSVVVQDGRNNPVPGLTGEDFQILENGREVPLAFFSVRAGTQGATSSNLAGLAAQGRFTNRIQSPTGGGVVAIIVDQLNVSPQDQAYGRNHLLKYLRTIRPDDRVALFALTSTGMRVLYDFSRDAESLVRALERLDPGESPPAVAGQQLPPLMLEELGAFARGTLGNVEAHFARLRGTTTIEALEVVADYLAGVPGRKNLVWISSGFPFSINEGGPSGMLFSNLGRGTQRAARALNHSDTAVYPVDARGLIAQSSDVLAPGRVPSLSEVMQPLDGVRSVADWTGGRAFFNTNGIGDAITRAVDDSRQTYIVGYYPPSTEWDGRFRRIEVKVRRPGVQVRHRQGYFAVSPEPVYPSSRASLAAAVLSPLEATLIPIDVTVSPAGTGYRLAIAVDPAAIALRTSNGSWSGELEVAVAQLLESREFVRDPDLSLPLSGDEAARQRLLNEGVHLTYTLDLRPAARQIRIVVRDAVTGNVGSLFFDAEHIRQGPDRSSTTERFELVR